MKKAVVFSLCCLLALVLAQSLSPQPAPLTRYVSNSDPTCEGQSPCYATMQAGVSALQAGETLVIQAGLYDESVTIANKNPAPGASEADRIFIVADPSAPWAAWSWAAPAPAAVSAATPSSASPPRSSSPCAG